MKIRKKFFFFCYINAIYFYLQIEEKSHDNREVKYRALRGYASRARCYFTARDISFDSCFSFKSRIRDIASQTRCVYFFHVSVPSVPSNNALGSLAPFPFIFVFAA